MKIKVILFFFLIISQISNKVYGQLFETFLEHYTVDNGLSQSTVLCIFQDSRGFLWVGTQDGLNKFDGYRFQLYKYNPLDSNSISSNWINAMAEDNDGNMWIATQNGLNKIERKSGQIKRYLHDPNNPYSIVEDEIFGVVIDLKGNVWTKTASSLNKLSVETGQFSHSEHVSDYFSSAKSDKGFPMVIDEIGIWIGSPFGLIFYNFEYEHFKSYVSNASDPNTISDNFVTDLIKTKDGSLWVSTKNGFNKFNTKTKKFKRYYPVPTDLTHQSNSISSMFLSYDNNLWLGTSGGGLLKFNPTDEKKSSYKTFKNEPFNNNSLGYDYILSLCEDNSHNLWIGTDGKGLDKLDLKPKNFYLYRGTTGDEGIRLSSNVIGSLLLLNDSILMIGTWENGIDVLNRNTGKTFNVSDNGPSGKRIMGNNVHSLIMDSRGLVWIGTRNGISIYDPKTNLFTDVFEKFKFNFVPNLNKLRIYNLFEDDHKNIWVSTKNGIFRFEPDKNTITPFWSNFMDLNSLSNNSGIYTMQDSDGYVWVGTANGLNRYDYNTNKFIRIGEKTTGKNNIKEDSTGKIKFYSISSTYIYSILEDFQDGSIWIGTGTGLNNYNKKDGTFVYYTEKDGIPNDMIYEIIQDRKGNIWFSTNRGIGMLDKTSNTIRSFDVGDGLQGLEFNNGASYISKKGEIFFGGSNGVTFFYPDSLKDNPFIPNIVISSLVKTNNDGKFEMNVEGLDVIELSYNDQNIIINFSALEYTKPSKNKYTYLMKNLNDNWVPIGNRNFQEFSNLPPGEYEFLVKGSNNDLVWNEEGASLKIIVHPPWYQTLWAYLAYLLTVVTIIYIFISSRTRKLKQANQVLRMKQLAAIEIAKQKEELTVKNKNITDSINYAKRIQEAMLPSEFLLRKLLPQSFILYKPKDIVSGDFYWISEHDGRIYVAAVDCTGHGVPGAFMSIIGYDLLRSIIKEQKISKPSEILNLLDLGISETFSKNVNQTSVKDGMDISMIVIDRNHHIIEYAGAFNPLLIIRDNKIIEINGNRFSIGRTDDNDQKYDNHVFQYKSGDMAYIFTDGYADQFGGPLGKKMKQRRFRHLILTISGLALNKQREFLDENIANWKGELEQVDDILIIGVMLE
ncbi:MAG: hypothetical protein CVU05_08565 [Bacteroidetes bacterium HGW-Bacteroidetes-21]|nr:MAG: hypothetical protein CVU05_08565 [Bacteroidetes bacterium HGW-Bacteroidetes-21]